MSVTGLPSVTNLRTSKFLTTESQASKKKKRKVRETLFKPYVLQVLFNHHSHNPQASFPCHQSYSLIPTYLHCHLTSHYPYSPF